ncbi:hypothetical protein EC968_009722, partial [Mortierella alpina]
MVRKSRTTERPAVAQPQRPEDSQEPAIHPLQSALQELLKQAKETSIQPTHPIASQEIQSTPAQHSQESQAQHSQESPAQHLQGSPTPRHLQDSAAQASQPQQHEQPQSEPQPLDPSCSASSTAPTIGRASKRGRSTKSTAVEIVVSDGNSSESELELSLPVRPPKEKRGRWGKRTTSRTERMYFMKLQWFLPVPGLRSNVPDMILIAEEFSSLMIELVTLRNAHSVSAAGNEVPEVCSSAGDTQQRALALRVQGMGLANENLAPNTKEQYITYLRLFRDFCNNTYAYENVLRYEVSEDKVLVFFKDIMFERRTPKVFRP